MNEKLNLETWLTSSLSGFIYKRKLSQQKLMYLIQNSVKVHQLLLTQLSLINRNTRSIFFTFSKISVCL